MEIFTRTHLSQHFPLIEKSHIDCVGWHWMKRQVMVIMRLSSVRRAMVHRRFLCHNVGLRIRVRRATTATLGRQKDMTPAGKPTVVQKMAFCCCSRERVSK